MDEAYADFVPPDRLPPDAIDPRTIRTRTFSKAYGLAGARIGYALAPAEIVAVFQKLRLHFGVNRTAQIGALAALDDDAFLRGVIAEVVRGRDDYHALAARHGLRVAAVGDELRLLRHRVARAQAEAMVAALLEGGRVRAQAVGAADRRLRSRHRRNGRRARAFAERFAEALDRVREKAPT